MKYILMMNAPKAGWENFTTWPPEVIQGHIGYMIALNADLKASGELLSAEGLAMPGDARIVRAGADGEPATDGVFPESKEFLAGYWIVDVENAERAHAIAARVSLAPGMGGKPMYIPVEVRQVMSGPPDEWV